MGEKEREVDRKKVMGKEGSGRGEEEDSEGIVIGRRRECGGNGRG